MFTKLMKEHGDLVMKICIGLIVFGAMLGGCSYLNNQFGLEQDNIIEQSIESVIESHTGIEIDLTPDLM